MEEATRADASQLVIEHGGDYDVRGNPLSGKREPDDPGVVVRWTRGGRQYAIACDKYSTRADNLAAIAATIEAMRTMERHGVVSADQAYKGVEALPPPGMSSATSAPIIPPRPPHDVLGVAPDAPVEVIEAAFKALALKHHPDRGGDARKFEEISAARDALRRGA